MPDGIPRNTRHFDSSVLPIPHQSGLRLSQPIWQRHIVPWSKRAQADVCCLVSRGWFWDDRLRDTGEVCCKFGCRHSAKSWQVTRQLVQKISNMVNQLKRMVLSPDTPSLWLPRKLSCPLLCHVTQLPPGFPLSTSLPRCVLRFGVHRGKTLGLVPITVVSSLCPVLCCLHRGSWSARFGVHRGKTLGTVPITGICVLVPFIPRLISWHFLWLDASLRVPGAMPR